MKDQKITRKKLKELYNHFKSCNKWKDIIGNILIEETGTSINVSGSKLQEAYNEANDTQKRLIEKYFKIEKPIDIRSKIKDFNSILKLSGEKLKNILPWKNPKTKEQISQNGLAKLQLVTKVYNGEIVLDFNNLNQRKYYNWFYKVSGGWHLYGVCSDVDFACLPFGLYFKSEEDARDAVSKFLDIYKEYLP